MKLSLRAHHLRRGDRAETAALEYLTDKGLKLVRSNFRCRLGEIDHVMRDGETLVFVEVRYRRTATFGGAAASIDSRKQRKLRNTAEYYRQTVAGADRLPCRFDVVSLLGDLDGDEFSIDWIRNAF